MHDQTLRIAIALPTLDPKALQSQALDDIVASLRRDGHDVEAFVEHDRLFTGEQDRGLFHYLRGSERHRRQSFDASIYPLGRDARPFQAALWMMQELPGLVWFLDPVPHHVFVGDRALRGDWDGYESSLGRAFSGSGEMLRTLVQMGWGTAAFYRRYDMSNQLAHGQRAVAAASRPLAERLARLGFEEVPLVPFPASPKLTPLATCSTTSPELPGAITVISVNPGYAGGDFDGILALRRLFPRCDFRVCVPSPVYHVVAAPAAHRRGVHDQITWFLDPSWGEIADICESSSLLLFLSPDVVCAERVLMVEAMRTGRFVMAPHVSPIDDLPDGAPFKLPLGSLLPEALVRFTQLLFGDTECRTQVREVMHKAVGAIPTAEETARRLIDIAVPIFRDSRPQLTKISAPLWSRMEERWTDMLGLQTIPSSLRPDAAWLTTDSDSTG